jgi:hypothetical protein
LPKKSRGQVAAFSLWDFIRDEDLLNFYAIFELISDEENPGEARYSINH